MKKSILVPRTAHYYIQSPRQKARKLLYVIHGYGQLASDFIQTFEALASGEVLVVAPEALSKFYNKKREPVANWMTSHERLDEIKDYINYLNQLHAEITAERSFDSIGILGFSQGVSTAMRWMTQFKEDELSFYACSGSIPPELTASDLSRFQRLDFNYYYGDNDQLLPIKKAEEQLQKLKDLGINFKKFCFEGRHEVPSICLEHLNRGCSESSEQILI